MASEKYRDFLTIYLKGMTMGAADAVPGVSGGTIALITGIYERLISAITSVTKLSFMSVLKSLRERDYGSVKEQLEDVDAWFLMVLGAGIVTSIFLVLNLMHFMLSAFPVQTYGFFFGLIAISAVVLYDEVDLSTRRSKLAAITGFIMAFALSGYGATSLGNSLPVIFLAGTIAISAMILPGISGSLILFILGQYEYLSAALSQFTDSIIQIRETGIEGLIDTAPPILVFILGAIVGLFSIANLVKKALEDYRKATMTFLVSLIVGALRAPLVEVGMHISEQGITWISILPQFALAALIGGIIVFILDHKTLSNSIA